MKEFILQTKHKVLHTAKMHLKKHKMAHTTSNYQEQNSTGQSCIVEHI